MAQVQQIVFMNTETINQATGIIIVPLAVPLKETQKCTLWVSINPGKMVGAVVVSSPRYIERSSRGAFNSSAEFQLPLTLHWRFGNFTSFSSLLYNISRVANSSNTRQWQ